jgi:hypothetical protein
LLLYFAAGRSEWRMLGANIQFLLAAGGLIVWPPSSRTVAFSIAGAPLTRPEKMLPTAANIAAATCCLGARARCLRRSLSRSVSFAAAGGDGRRGRLAPRHELAKGNVWRVLAIAPCAGLSHSAAVCGARSRDRRVFVGAQCGKPHPAEFLDKGGQAMEQKLGAWQIFSAMHVHSGIGPDL